MSRWTRVSEPKEATQGGALGLPPLTHPEPSPGIRGSEVLRRASSQPDAHGRCPPPSPRLPHIQGVKEPRSWPACWGGGGGDGGGTYLGNQGPAGAGSCLWPHSHHLFPAKVPSTLSSLLPFPRALPQPPTATPPQKLLSRLRCSLFAAVPFASASSEGCN